MIMYTLYPQGYYIPDMVKDTSDMARNTWIYISRYNAPWPVSRTTQIVRVRHSCLPCTREETQDLAFFPSGSNVARGQVLDRGQLLSKWALVCCPRTSSRLNVGAPYHWPLASEWGTQRGKWMQWTRQTWRMMKTCGTVECYSTGVSVVLKQSSDGEATLGA